MVKVGEGGFRAEHECEPGSWRELCAVDGAELRYGSWNYRHAWGGTHFACPACSGVFALGACVEGEGLPDLIRSDELGQIPRVELSSLAERLLDVSLALEDALWQKGMDLVMEAKADGDEDRASSLWIAAKLMRGGYHREKRRTLYQILGELGFESIPASLRVARIPGGGAVVYDVSRGALPVKAKVVEPEPVRVPDLEDYEEAILIDAGNVRVVDLS